MKTKTHSVAIGAVILIAALPAGAQTALSHARSFVVESRLIHQDQGDWRVDYRLRNAAGRPVILAPADLGARVSGWVSNSRVPAHGTPRRSEVTVAGSAGPLAEAEVIASADAAAWCRERLILEAWAGEPRDEARGRRIEPDPLATVTVPPGGLLRVRVRLEHRHEVHGDYDPLLGARDLDLRLGGDAIRDVWPLDREQYLAMPTDAWPEVPEDRRDDRQAHSGPDSLLLEAGLSGNQYFRFPERKVRYGVKYRLSFWYRIAPGTEGEFKARVAQYREGSNAWKVLSDGGSEHLLTGSGRWIHFDRVFRVQDEATTLALDFRLAGDEPGECWVDDVVLSPIDPRPAGP